MFSRHQQVVWILALIVVLVPYLGLMAVGGYALWKNGWFLLYGSVTAGITALFYGLALYLRRRGGGEEVLPLKFECPESWPPREREAWGKVQRLAQQAIAGDIPTNSIDDLRNLLEMLVREIARHYHPEHEDAYLDIQLPQLLKIVEKVAQDLRQVVQENVPGVHILTLRSLKQFKQMYDIAQPLYDIGYMAYRVATLPLSPVNALWREVRRYLSGQAINLSVGALKAEIVSYIVHRMGFYLIELYSGRVILDEVEFDKNRISAEQAELRMAQPDIDDYTGEFIRIVVVGQLKAGKSSLVNALRRTWHVQTDILPCTEQIQAYLMSPSTAPAPNESQPLPGRLMLVDTPGYEGLVEGRASRSLFAEVERADLILLACSARMASRKPDKDFLGRIQQFFQRHTHLKPPPVIVVGTFVDELRPRHDWNPPYRWNVTGKGDKLTPKEESIQGFLSAIRADLELSPSESVIPACTQPERIWNIAEGLIPAIAAHWEEARGVRENRHLLKHQAGKYRYLWKQSVNLGKGVGWMALKKLGLIKPD
ncbi:MAG: GTPase family protein [Thermogutta sp.]